MTAVVPRTRSPLLAGAILLLSVTAPLLAEATPRTFDPRDIQLTLYIRRVLMNDAELRSLNLGVSVHLGEASVWGTVPSYALAERALRLATGVKGIYAVRNDLHVTGVPREQTLRELVEGLAGLPHGFELPPPEMMPESGSGLRPFLLPDEPRPQEVVNARPDMPVWEKEKSEPLARSVASGVSLLPPVPVTTPAAMTSAPVMLLAPRGATALVELKAAVEHLRGADDRFRDVRAEISEGRVTLSGRVRETEDLIDLGRAISRLPGVMNVDLRGVRTGR